MHGERKAKQTFSSKKVQDPNEKVHCGQLEEGGRLTGETSVVNSVDFPVSLVSEGRVW